MFTKSAFVFLAVALSILDVNAVPAPHKADGCNDVTTTFVLPTTSIAPPSSTGLPSKNGTLVAAPPPANNNNGNQGGNGKGNQGGNGKGGQNNNSGGNKGGNAGNTGAGNGNAGSGSNNSTSTGNNGASSGNNSTSTGNNNTGGASNSTGNASGGDAQSSLTLDPKVIATGFENDGQDVPAAGQVASITSSNNFINFCLTVPNLPITNGQQIKTGSCNPAPMGVIPASTNMPSSKFTNPQNFGTIKSNTAFTVTMAISHLETGFFVNANENYFSAPQQVNSAGDVQGHSHVVIEQISSLTQTTATDPTKFAFFKGLNDKAQNGVLSADVTSGLPAGVYRLSSINTAANHQPVLGPIAQHGSFDDQIYFTVTDDGSAAAGATASN
ncbi:hypothetical protein EIP91_007201, partial [Steccherinum ochraceum]